jgi:NADH:ubiquinone oxidoreductase subunit 3 (subunit A)
MRKTLDKLISWTGLIMAAVLVVAGGLLMYASSFVANNVHEQLSQQNITMPAAAALETQAQKDALLQYAGQTMTTGDQAKAFADHYILVHMNAASDNRTYEEVSGEFLKLSTDPNADQAKVAELGQLRQTLFMGNTLRGLLLNAYAFGTMGTIAFWAAIASFVGAALLLALGLLGLRHAKTAADAAAAPVAGARTIPQTA